MILGDLCTRRCPFCDVAHGRPKPPDAEEPRQSCRDHRRPEPASTWSSPAWIATTCAMAAREHFADCIRAVREHSPATRIEVLMPDFRGRLDVALDTLAPRPARRDEPQSRNRAAPVQAGAARARTTRTRCKLLKEFKARFPGHPHQVRADAGPGRDRRGDPGSDARPARARRGHADRRASICSRRRAICRCCATWNRRGSRSSSARRWRWASSTPPADRWCARAITPTSRRTRRTGFSCRADRPSRSC